MVFEVGKGIPNKKPKEVSILFEVDMVFEVLETKELLMSRKVSILFEVDMVFEACLISYQKRLFKWKFQSYLRWIWYLKFTN